MVPLPNPSFEPKTHQWRPGAVAPSREVPSQICVVLGQKQPFSPKIAPKPDYLPDYLLNGQTDCTVALVFFPITNLTHINAPNATLITPSTP